MNDTERAAWANAIPNSAMIEAELRECYAKIESIRADLARVTAERDEALATSQVLTQTQIIAVLEAIERQHDPELGVSWGTLRSTIHNITKPINSMIATKYPEHEKLTAKKNWHLAVTHFLSFLMETGRSVHKESNKDEENGLPICIRQRPEKLIAEFFEIDEGLFEQEARAMIEEIYKMNAGTAPAKEQPWYVS